MGAGFFDTLVHSSPYTNIRRVVFPAMGAKCRIAFDRHRPNFQYMQQTCRIGLRNQLEVILFAEIFAKLGMQKLKSTGKQVNGTKCLYSANH
jgi:hypothetical protein